MPSHKEIDESLVGPDEVNLIDQLVKQMLAKSEKIKTVKGPENHRESEYGELVKATGEVRGRPLLYPYIGSGLGRGPYVQLRDGSIKMDLINGIGIHIMGHSHPEVIRASLEGALSDIVMQGNLQPNVEYLEYSKKLVSLASKKSRLKYVWLATCGSLANENALKASRQKMSPAKFIIAMDAAFAGRTTMMAEITDNPGFKQGLPDYNEVLRVPFYNKREKGSSEKSLSILKEHVERHKGQICTFTFEPMQGEGGYNVAPREFFVPMLEFCREQGIPIWLDEVQTFARTGQFFAFETLDIGEYVDLCTIAKTAQNGATFFTEELNPKPGLIAGTFSGSTPALKAGMKILDILENERYMGSGGKIQEIHEGFISMLNHLNETSCKGLLQDAEGLGLMVAVTPLDGSKEEVSKLLQNLYKNGLITFSCGRKVTRLRFLLPAIMTKEDISLAGKIIEKSILEMS